MISAYQTALTGLQAFGTKIQANANNIANADTDGFKKTKVINASTAPQGVKAQVNTVAREGAFVNRETQSGREQGERSNVELATELVDMKLNSTMYRANLKTLETVNDMTGTLLKITS